MQFKKLNVPKVLGTHQWKQSLVMEIGPAQHCEMSDTLDALNPQSGTLEFDQPAGMSAFRMLPVSQNLAVTDVR